MPAAYSYKTSLYIIISIMVIVFWKNKISIINIIVKVFLKRALENRQLYTIYEPDALLERTWWELWGRADNPFKTKINTRVYPSSSVWYYIRAVRCLTRPLSVDNLPLYFWTESKTQSYRYEIGFRMDWIITENKKNRLQRCSNIIILFSSATCDYKATRNYAENLWAEFSHHLFSVAIWSFN